MDSTNVIIINFDKKYQKIIEIKNNMEFESKCHKYLYHHYLQIWRFLFSIDILISYYLLFVKSLVNYNYGSYWYIFSICLLVISVLINTFWIKESYATYAKLHQIHYNKSLDIVNDINHVIKANEIDKCYNEINDKNNNYYINNVEIPYWCKYKFFINHS